jgi:endonuclease/exonuclease/phosphatase family metal-dependent hydrolase
MGLPKLKIVHEDPGTKAIVFQVDNSMDEGAHALTLRGSSIYLTAQNSNVLLQMTRQLRQLILNNNAQPVVNSQMCAQLTGKMDMANLPFRVLSQNILFKDIEGGNTVLDRQPRFHALMQEYCPDVIAIQEYSEDWVHFMRKEFGTIYTEAPQSGLGLLFRTDRYEIQKSGHFYMSPTPNIKSQFEGDSGPRSCIWAIVTDTFTGTDLLFINCHPDWNNDTQRALQVEVIFEQMSDKMQAYPTIFCGDFNTQPTGPIYPRIVQEFKDPYQEADLNLSDIDYTCHSFGAAAKFIDYTFYNEPLHALTYRIIDDMYNGHVSDHYGTFTDFCLDK